MKINVEKKINLGLATLRIYLSFLVVSSHWFKPDFTYQKKKILLKIIHNETHVPIFYILSFYFCFKLFKSKNIGKIKLRFQRLLIPYFIWPIIIWSLRNLLSSFYIKIDKISFKNLILQFLTANIFYGILWYLYDLIFITLLIIIIHFLFDEKLIFYILINIKIFSIFFTYSNYNYILFSQYKLNIMYTFGRFFEIIPYCTISYFLSSLNFVHILSKNRIISINIFFPILILIIRYNIFSRIIGFGYQGLGLIFSSFILFFIFSLIPNERIRNKYIIKLILIISSHTPGIYFIHYPLIYFLKIFSFLKSTNLKEVFIIYFISYFISLFGKLIFRKTKLINLFQ